MLRAEAVGGGTNRSRYDEVLIYEAAGAAEPSYHDMRRIVVGGRVATEQGSLAIDLPDGSRIGVPYAFSVHTGVGRTEFRVAMTTAIENTVLTGLHVDDVRGFTIVVSARGNPDVSGTYVADTRVRVVTDSAGGTRRGVQVRVHDLTWGGEKTVVLPVSSRARATSGISRTTAAALASALYSS